MSKSDTLLRILESEAERAGARAVQAAAAKIIEKYDQDGFYTFRTEEDCLAYALVRMPATFRATLRCLRELTFKPNSLLDLGSGPGTAAWAAEEAFGLLNPVTLIERDSGLASLGRRLETPSTRWIVRDLTQMDEFSTHDLVVFAYSLGELPAAAQSAVLDRAWQAAGRALLVVGPGTPGSAKRILMAREQLLSLGAHVAAPCPHSAACPLEPPDWCHFAVRVERGRLHRLARGGALGYEDEEYSYVLAVREPQGGGQCRIIRPPRPSKGLVQLELCAPAGLRAERITRKHELWKVARKARWGDRIPFIFGN